MKIISSMHVDMELKEKAKRILKKRGYSISFFIEEKFRELIKEEEAEAL